MRSPNGGITGEMLVLTEAQTFCNSEGWTLQATYVDESLYIVIEPTVASRVEIAALIEWDAIESWFASDMAYGYGRLRDRLSA